LNWLRTLRSDLFSLDPGQARQFAIALLSGLLYRVKNTVGALRIADQAFPAAVFIAIVLFGYPALK
jgi:hypothetical protein